MIDFFFQNSEDENSTFEHFVKRFLNLSKWIEIWNCL